MYSLNQVKKSVSCGRDPARSLPLWRGFLLIPLVLLCFAFSLNAAPVPQTPDPGSVNDPFGTADGAFALSAINGGVANSGFGWYSLGLSTVGSFNTGCGAGTLIFDNAGVNTAVGAAALLFNTNDSTFGLTGTENVAVGAAALENNTGVGAAFAGEGSFNNAVGAFALNLNTTAFSNNAFGDRSLENNVIGANNTAVGDIALAFNDSDGAGLANNNVAVGGGALVSLDALTGNTDGSENTAVGANAGPNIVNGFNNTYLGNFVGSSAGDEDSTIRIGDLSQGAGSVNCYIGGIATNPQPIGGTVVAVTVDLANDHLGYDPGVGRAGNPAAAPQRAVPTRRGRLQPTTRPGMQHEAMLDKKVQTLETTVGQQQQEIAQQQKQIEALNGKLNQQAEQIQKVSAQLEMIRPAPRVVNNQ